MTHLVNNVCFLLWLYTWHSREEFGISILLCFPNTNLGYSFEPPFWCRENKLQIFVFYAKLIKIMCTLKGLSIPRYSLHAIIDVMTWQFNFGTGKRLFLHFKIVSLKFLSLFRHFCQYYLLLFFRLFNNKNILYTFSQKL